MEYRLRTASGRELLVAPCTDELPRLNVGIVSVRGNLIDSVTIEASDILGLARGVARVARRANELFAEELEHRQRETDKRHQAALERNPWQTLDSAELKRKGLV